MRSRPQPFIAGVVAALVVVTLPAHGRAASQIPFSGVNSQVNMTAPPVSGYTDNFPSNRQFEPAVARDPVSGAFIAGSIDLIDRPLCSQTGTSGSLVTGDCSKGILIGLAAAYLSADGVTWSQPAYANGSGSSGACTSTIHTLPGYCQASLISGFDPGVAFGPKPSPLGFTFSSGARAYFVNLPAMTSRPNGPPVVAVSRSDDDGQTWLPPVIASSTNNLPAQVNDKDSLWSDANPSSPCFGDAYVGWDLFQSGSDNIEFTRSTDGGDTWSAAAQLTPAYANNSNRGPQGTAIRSLPDGTVVVAWEDYLNGIATTVASTSHDCGQTFSPEVAIAPLTDLPYPLPGGQFDTNSFPTMDTDLQGRIYVSWADYSTKTAVIKLSSSGDGGAHWSSPVAVSNPADGNAFFNATAVEGNGNALVVSYLNEVSTGTLPGAGVSHYGAMYAVSADHGATFVRRNASDVTGDPDGSSRVSLRSQYIGDYTGLVVSSVNGAMRAFPIWTDSRNAVPCPAVDAFRAAVHSGQNPPVPDPDVANQCPAGFGNSDIYSASVGLLAVSVVPPTTSEGTPFAGTVATFTDPDSTGDPSVYTASVAWGDGSSSPGTVAPGSNGTFVVSASHTYAEGGNPPVAVTVTHAGGNTDTGTANAIVSDPALSLTGTSFAAAEATGYNGTVATLTDADSAASLSEYTATVNWADGTSSSGTVTPNGSGGYGVAAAHTYAEGGNYLVRVMVIDSGGSTATTTITGTVADAALTASAASVSATEGTSFTGAVATFTDADPNPTTASMYTATVKWGDGTISAGSVTANGAGGYTIAGAHTFAEEGPRTITASVRDKGGSTASVAETASVADAPLTVTGAGVSARTGTAFSGVVATLNDADPAGVASDYAATITWGDGTSSTGSVVAVAGSFSVSGTHTYSQQGTYLVGVAATDGGGSHATGTGSAAVSDDPLTISISPWSATEGAAFSVPVATFTDADPKGTLSQYTAIIAWGDGTSSPGSVAANGSGGYTVTGNHTYAEEGSQAAAVTVNDVAGATATASGTMPVGDAALTAKSVLANGTEGAPTAMTLASITDADPAGVASDYTVTIGWADGTTSPGSVSASGGSLLVTGSHAYGEEGVDNATVTITDGGGATTSVTTAITVADAALTIAAAVLHPPQGYTFSGPVAYVTDGDPGGAASDYTASIAWGDGSGSTATVVANASGGFAIDGSHVYSGAGTYTTKVSVTDAGGSTSSATGSASVAPAAITLSPLSGPPSTIVTVAGSRFNPGDQVILSFDGTQVGTAIADTAGSFSNARFTVPASASPGKHTVRAVGQSTGITGQTKFQVHTNWLTFGLNFLHLRFNSYENVLGSANVTSLAVAWAVKTGGPVHASPAAATGTVFDGSEDGRVYAVDTVTGSVLWTGVTGGSIDSSPVVSPYYGRVYVGSGDGRLYAFAAAGCGAAQCQPLWRVTTGGPITSSPVLFNGTLFVGSADGDLYALSAAGCGATTCHPIWSAATGGAITSSPAVSASGSTVYVGSSDGAVYALTAATGARAWSTMTGGPVESSPASAGSTVYVGSDDGSIYALSAATGAKLWSGPTAAAVVAAPAVASGVVYVAGEDGRLRAYAAGGCGGLASCSAQWTSTSGASMRSSPAVAGGIVFVGDDSGRVMAFSATGCAATPCSALASVTLGGAVSASPAVADGVVYVGSDDGNITALSSGGCATPPCGLVTAAAAAAPMSAIAGAMTWLVRVARTFATA